MLNLTNYQKQMKVTSTNIEIRFRKDISIGHSGLLY